MASISKQANGRFRVQIDKAGRRDSKIFDTRHQAMAWAVQREEELTGKQLPVRTLDQALARYAEEVSPGHAGCNWELVRIGAMRRSPLAARRLADITGADIASWRDQRLKQVAPATVLREMKQLRAVFESARRDFGWIRANPMIDVTKPKAPPSRKRRIAEDEVQRLMLGFGLGETLRGDTDTQRVGLCFLLALETAMRAGEILGLTWGAVDLESRVADLPRTKNGDVRQVPLSRRAVEILQAFGPGDSKKPVVGVLERSRDALFRKIRKRADLDDLHFHDSRAEAIWRLSKKFDVLQLARVIGHRDLKSLMIYYNESAADLARQMD